jgi:aminopeptidase N
MKAFLITLIVSFILIQAKAQQHACKAGRADATALDPRSDTIDILHTDIFLDLSDLPTPGLVASTQIDFSARVNGVSTITLDLLGLTVDSVLMNNNLMSFNQGASSFTVDLGFVLTPDAPQSLTVYYRGVPPEDASGFGGFSFSGGFAYNIGVGFLADPHNFGRVWFPCFDNFVERCTYSVEVLSPESLSAYCGGIMVSDTVENGIRRRRWELGQEIPSYLASVAVAGFTELNYTWQSMLYDSLNVKYAAIPGDTQAVKNAFVTLEQTFHEFENHFGPYRWDRVGYVFVPFGAGAMEHATNIAYPRTLLPLGEAANKHIMAHELSHHWFGDLATCRTASEMWLNEGWASYCERLYDEWITGRAAYDAAVRLNHQEMLQLCHVRDGGYWPLSNVPHEYTYSNSTYERPSDLIHTLRTYMGDSLFYEGIRFFMNQYIFRDANSNDLRDALETATGLDLTDYFADWVDTPGWGHFVVDSLENLGGDAYRVYYSQNSAGNDHVYRNVPFQISFRSADFGLFSSSALLSGPNGSFDVNVPFAPVFATLNRNEAISEAMTGEERFIKTTGNANWSSALIEINTESVSDSVLVRVEHHWVAPDPVKAANNIYRLSPNRYWRIDGVLRDGFSATLKFTYNGRTSGTNSGWLDNELITDENNLVLLYRLNPADDWTPVDATKQTFTNTTDKFGNFTVDSLMLGEYTFAVIDSSLGLPQISSENELVSKLYPNPADSKVTLEWNRNDADYVDILDLSGRSFGRIPVLQPDKALHFKTDHLQPGVYKVITYFKSGVNSTSSLIKE